MARKPRGSGKKPAEPVSWSDAPEVQEVAAKLISDHHGYLAEARVKYIFRSGPWLSQRKETWYSVDKVSGKNEFLMELDFVISVKREVWNQLSPEHKEALLDEALCMCDKGGERKDGSPTWRKQAFDFRGFRSVIRRYGLWNEDLKLIQLGLEDKKQVTLEQVIEAKDTEEVQSTPGLQLVQ